MAPLATFAAATFASALFLYASLFFSFTVACMNAQDYEDTSLARVLAFVLHQNSTVIGSTVDIVVSVL